MDVAEAPAFAGLGSLRKFPFKSSDSTEGVFPAPTFTIAPIEHVGSHSDQASFSILLQSLGGLSNLDANSNTTVRVGHRLAADGDTGDSTVPTRTVVVTLGTPAVGRVVTGGAGLGHGPPGDIGEEWLPF